VSISLNTAAMSSVSANSGARSSSIMPAACASPLASIKMRCGVFFFSMARRVLSICAPALQHKQPPDISATGMPFSANTAPSMPISPNSLTIISHCSCCGFCAIRLRMALVLPVPRKPVKRWVEILGGMGVPLMGVF